jgi:hypothetical protein
MTARTTAEQRAEISRQNGRRSHGPTSPEGKAHSRMNALKHGMTARLPVLPGEDPETFRQHVEGIVDSLIPRGPLELALAEQVALSLWKIERAERVEAARGAAALRAAEARAEDRRQEELAALGRWLLADSVQAKREAAEDLLAFLPEDRHAPFRAGRGEPLVILLRIQATADGCRWLLDRWDRLRGRLEQKGGWDIEEMIEAAQLRGERPLLLETAEWECLLQPRYAGNTAYLEEGRRQLLDQLTEGPAVDRAGIAAALRGLVEEETARLEELEEARREREAADRSELADLLAVDTTREGEQVRRCQVESDRKLHRAIQSLLKLRRDDGVAAGPDAEGVPDPAGPVEPPNGLTPAAAVVPVTVAIAPGAVEPPDGHAPLATDVPVTASGPVESDEHPAGVQLHFGRAGGEGRPPHCWAAEAALPVGRASVPASSERSHNPGQVLGGLAPTATGLPAMATATAGAIEPEDGREGAREAAWEIPVPPAAAATDREPDRANEPTPHTSGEPIRRNEPSPAVGGDGNPPNEPTETGRIAQLRSADQESADGPAGPPPPRAGPGGRVGRRPAGPAAGPRSPARSGRSHQKSRVTDLRSSDPGA